MVSSKRSNKIKTGSDVIVLNIIAYVFLGLIALICLVPFIMIVSGSFSSEEAIIQNGFSFLPQDFSLEAYKTVFKDPFVVFRAYATTIGLTVVGTVVGLLFQTMTAYVLSRKDFEWRGIFSIFFYFTTLFSGGLVPYYILITQKLNLRDSYLALLLPMIFSVYNLLIMKSYIMGIPDSLIEAAKIDGCSEFRSFIFVVLPLSKPIIATMALFYGVGHWNQFFEALIYINSPERFPLQLVLRNLLLQGNNAMTNLISGGMSAENAKYASEMMQRAEILKYAVIIVSTLPILVVYPFLQKYFVKGIMAGSLKG